MTSTKGRSPTVRTRCDYCCALGQLCARWGKKKHACACAHAKACEQRVPNTTLFARGKGPKDDAELASNSAQHDAAHVHVKRSQLESKGDTKTAMVTSNGDTKAVESKLPLTRQRAADMRVIVATIGEVKSPARAE
jgi:hypothetical protein